MATMKYYDETLEVLFLAWFLWRCGKGEIKSKWTRAVALKISVLRGIDVIALAEKYDFENKWQEYK